MLLKSSQIAFQRICRNYKYFNFISLQFWFSKCIKSEKLLSAELAMKYVQQIIKEQKLNDKDNSKPLMKRILQVKLDQNSDDCNKDGIQKVNEKMKRQLFVQGILIDRKIFTQDRIQKPSGTYKNLLFCFYPNVMVTQPVFKALLNKSIFRIMIYGPYGISKTSSIILYWYLSSAINDYLFDATDKERKQFFEKYPYVQIPRKLFYYTVNIKESEIDIKKILISQCPEKLKKTLRKKENLKLSFSQFCEKIKQEYDLKNMGCDIVFDQINAIVSILRKLKAFEEKQRNLKKKGDQSTASDINIEEQFFNGKKTLNLIKKMKNIGFYGKQIYNSSVNIQHQFLGKKLPKNPYTLQIQGHSTLQKVLIEYFQSSQTAIGQQDIDQVLIKQMQKQFPQEYLPDYKNMKIEINNFHENPEYKKWLPNIRPLIIFDAIHKLKKQTLKKPDDSTKFFKQSIQKIFKGIEEQVKQKMKQFLQKQQEEHTKSNKINLFFHLQAILVQRIKQSNKDGQTLENQIISVTFDELLKSGFKQSISKVKKIAREAHNKEVFSIYQNQMVFHISVKTFLSFWNEYVCGNQSLSYETLKTFQMTNMGGKGTIFESMFINSVMSSLQQNKQVKLKIGELDFFTIYDKKPFTHFFNVSRQKDSERKDSIENLSQIIDFCLKNPGKDVFGYPVTYPLSKPGNKPDQTSVPSVNSPAIDFIIAKRNGNILSVFSFDIKIGENAQQDGKKTMNRINQIKEMVKEQIKKNKYQDINDLKWTQTIIISSKCIIKQNSAQNMPKFINSNSIENNSQQKNWMWELFEGFLLIINK